MNLIEQCCQKTSFTDDQEKKILKISGKIIEIEKDNLPSLGISEHLPFDIRLINEPKTKINISRWLQNILESKVFRGIVIPLLTILPLNFIQKTNDQNNQA
jgi:hypothetical protein